MRHPLPTERYSTVVPLALLFLANLTRGASFLSRQSSHSVSWESRRISSFGPSFGRDDGRDKYGFAFTTTLSRPVRNLHRRLNLASSEDVSRQTKGLIAKSKAGSKKLNTSRSKSRNEPPNPKVESSSKTKQPSSWRIYGVEVHPDDLVVRIPTQSTTPIVPRMESSASVQPSPPAGSYVTPAPDVIHPALLRAVYQRLFKIPSIPSHANATSDGGTISSTNAPVPPKEVMLNVRVVRRSLDARSHQIRNDGSFGPRWVYVVDVDLDLSSTSSLSSSLWQLKRLQHQPGRQERLDNTTPKPTNGANTATNTKPPPAKKPTVLVVGAGPAGLLAALTLAQSQHVNVIVLERGQPVEMRGRDIGALMHRRSLNRESNFAYGEGGAGTWSDGKLTTRIGRNSESVRHVLETLVQYGAPSSILIEGAPHLGTDNLVRLLRNMRHDLRQMGGDIRFGHKVTKLHIRDGIVEGVDFEHSGSADQEGKANPPMPSGTFMGDAVILATGHSARDVYEQLHQVGVKLEPKGFAVGYRVEHPQKLINKIQYGTEWGMSVVTGKTNTDRANQEYLEGLAATDEAPAVVHVHHGRLPVPSYRLAMDQANDGTKNRGVYSFCMCPGGQIVPASTEPNEVCVNGMSFSKRDSQWANSALVVTISPEDEVLVPYRSKYGVMAGVAFQRDMERKASAMGGGNLTVPVQRLTDFVAGRPSTSAPPSSYRLGIKPSACHEIYPSSLITSIRTALTQFDKVMPGFLCDEGLLHAVETRTSSPVRVSRDDDTLQAIGLRRLYPAGEGAGFAGGIVSAAVDGMIVAEAALEHLIQPNEKSPARRKLISKGVDSFY